MKSSLSDTQTFLKYVCRNAPANFIAFCDACPSCTTDWTCLIFGYEAAVSLLQAMIFAVLATVYFRLSGEAGH